MPEEAGGHVANVGGGITAGGARTCRPLRNGRGARSHTNGVDREVLSWMLSQLYVRGHGQISPWPPCLFRFEAVNLSDMAAAASGWGRGAGEKGKGQKEKEEKDKELGWGWASGGAESGGGSDAASVGQTGVVRCGGPRTGGPRRRSGARECVRRKCKAGPGAESTTGRDSQSQATRNGTVSSIPEGFRTIADASSCPA